MPNRDQLLILARQQPEVIVDDFLALEAQHAALQQEHLALKARLAQNSFNSHKPPSTDGYTKPAPKSLRGKSGRRSGGQPGHPGCTLQPVEHPDLIIPHPLAECPHCHQSLSDQEPLDPIKAQVFDLPPQKLYVAEHRAERKHCPHCRKIVAAPLPTGVSTPTQYGESFKAWLVYLRCQQLLPLDRITQMSDHLFHAPVSQATICDALEEAAEKLTSFEAVIIELLVLSDLAHADESGLRVAGKLHWLHVLATRFITWYGVHAHRGPDAINEFNLLPRYLGRLVHDCLAAYLSLPCGHALCNEHLRRELTFVHEQLHQPWARQMFQLLTDLHAFVQIQKQIPATGLTDIQLLDWSLRYDSILAQGRVENPPLPTPPIAKRGRSKQTKPQNLLDRMEKHKPFIFAFARDFAVPFSNNQAEQDIRMIKVLQKITGGFRTLQGARTFARIRSYLSTVRKNNRDVFGSLVDAFAGNPFLPTGTVT